MNKLDLSDCSFMIPVMLESEDRKRNLNIVIEYLLKYFNTTIMLAQQGVLNPEIKYLNEKYDNIKVIFYETTKEYFHKNKLLNMMIEKATTPYVVSYDSDVVFYPHQYMEAVESLRNNTSDFCFPFDKPNHRVMNETINTLKNTLDLNTVESQCKQYHWLTPPGGCLFMNKESFRNCGFENEQFKSWGEEDIERIERITKLGYRIKRTEGKLFHIEHSRTINSIDGNPHSQQNKEEYNKVVNMNKDQLITYIKTWNYLE